LLKASTFFKLAKLYYTMIRKLSIALVFLLASVVKDSYSGTPTAYFMYSTFNSPDKGPYLETYLAIVGSSLKLKKTENLKYQGMVEVILTIRQDEKFVYADKYILSSPVAGDTVSERLNFIDQQRIALANGKYELEMEILDKNDPKELPVKIKEPIELNYPTDGLTISDIQLVESIEKSVTPNILSKSGYDLVPYVSNFYPENIKTLTFYTEIYNSDKIMAEGQKYLINVYIESEENSKKDANCFLYIKETAKPVNVIARSFSMEQLPSGNYNLVVEIKDQENKPLKAKKIFIQRSNPPADTVDIAARDITGSFVDKMNNKDTLVDYIKSLAPISTENEKIFANNQLKVADVPAMKLYLYNFWYSRNKLDPEHSWNKYNGEVQEAQKLFGGSKIKGYLTDRGRVFLQYGPPNTNTQSYFEPNSYPYEVWHYYKLGNFTNKKFVFYDPSLTFVGFILLHSDVPGEIYDKQWQIKLQSRNTKPQSDDDVDVIDNYGGRAKENYKSPK
jgi:GWxTD domain-containing protein